MAAAYVNGYVELEYELHQRVSTIRGKVTGDAEVQSLVGSPEAWACGSWVAIPDPSDDLVEALYEAYADIYLLGRTKESP